MSTPNAPLTIRDMIEPAIMAAGGWVNTHAHADRAYTLSPDVLEMRRTCTLQQKWDALDALKRNSTEEDFYRRFSMFFENQIAQGVSALATFVDIDPQSEDRAIKAGLRAREHYQDQLTVKFANQTLKGVIHPEARKWFDIGAELVDIIGALPKRDERDYGRGDEAFDIIMETAKSRNKMVHVHVDQFNESLEYETEQLCEKTIQHGMQGKVVAIHGISIAAHSRAYRQRLYTLMREADVMMIACPTAWIDTPRSEQIGPMHNSMTPVDELVPAGITVALGTDNVCDAMVPWNAGDMWHEMTTLATGCRFDYFDELVKIATVNGRKAIGNESLEYETEQLCEKTIQHGMQGKVVAIHGISIAAHSRAYRQRLYTLMREADVMMIACPTAWIDTPRSEQIGPMHNSMTPVDELVPAGITVALGTDNVCDAMVPWNAGDMWHEMTTLATGCRFDYFDELVKIATVNGRKAIGID